jgi:hypothetical protein
MRAIECINILGIVLNLAGFILLASIDWSAMRIDVAEGDLPEDIFSGRLEAELSGKEYRVSRQEKEYSKLVAARNPRKSLRAFRIAIGVVIAGTLCQFGAAVLAIGL